MAVSALSPDDAASERDDRLEMVDLAVDAGATNPYEYRLGALDSIDTARWAAAADPDDPRIVDLLRTAGELAAAVMTSTVSDKETTLPIRAQLRVVPSGLPPESLTATQWAEGIWAATAAADAPSAVRLARIRSTVEQVAAPAGEVELAQAVAALWTGENVGQHLIAALQSSDPDAASGAERDRRLDVTTPAAAVFRHLLGDDDEALRASVDAAGDAFANYWNASVRKTQPGRALALPLSGLVRLAYEFERPIGDPPAGVPPAILVRGRATLTLCPVCASPFHQGVETECGWCGTDLTQDAPLERTLSDYLDDDARACPACERTNRVTALRCWKCSTSLVA